MKKRNFLVTLFLSFTLILAACGTSDEGNADGDSGEEKNCEPSDDAINVAMVTDVGGVDDKSFNQSAWEGLQAYGEEYCLEEDEHYDYAQSTQDADYEPNLNRLTGQDYELVYGIGYKLTEAIEKVAGQNPDTNYALVDEVASEMDNLTSITFKEHQGSFLVGVAAALKTESNQVGFVGGVDSPLINKFEVGFEAGVKSIDPSIEVDVRYAESFDDAGKGRQIANSMYNSGVDIIYHAAGGAGNGVFSEAKDIKTNDPESYVWVIGVDRDQYDEGTVTVDGTDYNVTFTSMVKRVDIAVQDVAERMMEGDFPGGENIEYGLSDEGVSVADTNEEAYTEEIATAVSEWEQKIIDGELDIPSTHDELEEFLNNL
ncbi:BMP family lipoprotein [Tenuibacillus multivorans]|uniref:Basic membrane protein A n=1 Tax=Tenuibacillus multivorans TaxID=237069 RepID=A0A1G9XU60_9BACI|nr:BMP family protein [Tenuibacillus multivorans]GEL75818.1 CD4+ T-cell-stimulating antigen [Tenuibacillus multivorans]SDN00324.1 basic membrane protein A [Tenuibacillus multivorans]